MMLEFNIDVSELQKEIKEAQKNLQPITIEIWLLDYWKHLEYGTAPHIIKPKNKKVLAFEWTKYKGGMIGQKGRRELKIARSRSNMVFFKQIKHPGTKKHPFVRPGLLASKSKILKYLNEHIGKNPKKLKKGIGLIIAHEISIRAPADKGALGAIENIKIK